MNREIGNPKFPIWLLGDSEPFKWKDLLEDPFDDRHPIVHNIWTSIIDKIQDRIYRQNNFRINTKDIFIRNAVANSITKPKNNLQIWTNNIDLQIELTDYQKMIELYHPKLIISFGSFAFEFGRRCLKENPEYPFIYWGAKNLGKEFFIRSKGENCPILLPLLHRSIAGGKFLESHKYFCETSDLNDSNYFNYVARLITPLFINIPECFII
ncbi:MAG: hypothetical protein ACOYO1_18540 [Bacteroidales bacterium]